MNAKMTHAPSLLDVSPALETDSLTLLSTYWMPLHELIAHWMNVDTLLLPAPVAPLLTAIGHALFALSRETRARQLPRIARTQQERLWKLTAEVLADQTGADQQDQREEGES